MSILVDELSGVGRDDGSLLEFNNLLMYPAYQMWDSKFTLEKYTCYARIKIVNYELNYKIKPMI